MSFMFLKQKSIRHDKITYSYVFPFKNPLSPHGFKVSGNFTLVVIFTASFFHGMPPSSSVMVMKEKKIIAFPQTMHNFTKSVMLSLRYVFSKLEDPSQEDVFNP